MREAVLCYAENSRAYFTTKKLSEQWGDDWNDAPFDCNAGRPYTYDPASEHDQKQDSWDILVCYWAGPFTIPSGQLSNPGVSVEQINSGRVAWLWPEEDYAKYPSIPAGVTYHEFRSQVETQGGTVGVLKKVPG